MGRTLAEHTRGPEFESPNPTQMLGRCDGPLVLPALGRQRIPKASHLARTAELVSFGFKGVALP